MGLALRALLLVPLVLPLAPLVLLLAPLALLLMLTLLLVPGVPPPVLLVLLLVLLVLLLARDVPPPSRPPIAPAALPSPARYDMQHVHVCSLRSPDLECYQKTNIIPVVRYIMG